MSDFVHKEGNGSLFDNSYSAPSNTYSKTYSNTDKWKCPSGYKRDMEYGCVKGFVANFYDLQTT